MKDNPKTGVAMPSIIALVSVVAIIGIAVYYANTPEEGQNKMVKNDVMMKQDGEGAMMMEKKEISVSMTALNNSKQSGTATLTDVGGKTKITAMVSSGPVGTPQPSHIHMGTCPKPGAILHPLTGVVNGKAETILDLPLATLMEKSPLAILVHKSKDEVKTFTSCGDVSKSMEGVMEKGGDAMMEKEGGAMMSY